MATKLAIISGSNFISSSEIGATTSIPMFSASRESSFKIVFADPHGGILGAELPIWRCRHIQKPESIFGIIPVISEE